MFKPCFGTLTFLFVSLSASTAAGTYFIMKAGWTEALLCVAGCAVALFFLYRIYRRNARKIAFMFDAVDNDDYSFRFPTTTLTESDNTVGFALNRIKDLLLRAKADAIEKEKYYEIILNCISTGIVVADDQGNVIRTNQEALRLLGLSVFTHLTQAGKIDQSLPGLLAGIQDGEKQQVAFSNERGTVRLAIRSSGIRIGGRRLRIVAMNDIDHELDEKEIDSWVRLTRVLTHEIMNAVTPLTSLSNTLLSLYDDAHPDIRHGLEVIGTTGKNLIAFVESYRKFTHIPTPEPTLFYVGRFIDRLVKLAVHHDYSPDIRIETDVRPDDLILYADEKLISQVMLNLLKNARQAIGAASPGEIKIRAYCKAGEEVVIEVSNNGPQIPPEIAGHIFIPFFTTKEGGSGIGLSVSRQIMRLSGGSIVLKPYAPGGPTVFMLTFK